jgi:hypothetical protein
LIIKKNNKDSKKRPGQRNLKINKITDDQKKRKKFNEKWRLFNLVTCVFKRGAKKLIKVIKITISSKLLK